MSVMMRSATSSACSKAACKGAPVANVHPASARRGLLLASGSLLGLSMGPKAALALIPDEEDEELIKRAKENRARTLALQQEKTRSFMESEGLANGKLNKDLIPVQKAVYKLADTGKQLEAGDVKQASRILSEDWVKGVSTAVKKFSGPADGVETQLYKLQSAASKEDLLESKTSFVALVDAFQAWATAAGVNGALKGL